MNDFETARLELFRQHGFDGATEWLGDESGYRTAAVVGGEGDRVTLLIHGIASNAGEWALVAPKLDGRLVIADWPGSGLTPPARARTSGFRRFAVDWVLSMVDALGVDQVEIVGSSAGGYMGLVFALEHPERVRRLVQVGSFPGLRRSAPFIFRLFATPLLGPLALGQKPKDAEANRKQVFANLVADASKIPTDMLDADLRAMALPHSASSAAGYCRALLNPLTGIRKQVMVADDLTRLAVPTLMLWGVKDNFVRPETVRPVLDAAESVTLELVEGAGHLLTYEVPDRVADSTRSFLGT